MTHQSLIEQGPDAIERGTLRLHYVQKPIGYERYEIVQDGANAAAHRRISTSPTAADACSWRRRCATKADFTPIPSRPRARAIAS